MWRPLPPTDPVFRDPPGNAVLDHLAHGTKLFADGLSLPHRRFQHDVGVIIKAHFAEDDLAELFRREFQGNYGD
jgi:hypothetical protein